MGIFDFVTDILGGDDETKTEESFVQDKTSDVARAGVSNTTTTAEKDTTEKGTDITLGKATRKDLKSVIGTIADDVAGGSLEADKMVEIGDLLLERAMGAEEATNAANAAIIAEANRVAASEIATLNTELAIAAGGTRFNSYVAGATAEAGASAQSQLAALKAQLEMAARDKETQEIGAAGEIFAGAAGARSATLSTLATLADALKGGKRKFSGKTNESGKEEASTVYNEAIKEITHAEGTGTSSTSDDRDLFDLIGLFTPNAPS